MGNYYPIEIQLRGKAKNGAEVFLVSLIETGPKTTIQFFKDVGFGTGSLKGLKPNSRGGEGKLLDAEANLKEIVDDKYYVIYQGEMPD